MKVLARTVTVLAVGILLTSMAMADDVEDVKAAYLEHVARNNAGDPEGFVEQHLPGHSSFGPTGGLLSRNESIEEEKRRVRAGFDAARKRNPSRSSVRGRSNVQVKHIEARVYGGLTGVATAYTVGTVTLPDGRTRQSTYRITTVWVKQSNGEWREVHDHVSLLVVATPSE
jgi:hypothetical protein